MVKLSRLFVAAIILAAFFATHVTPVQAEQNFKITDIEIGIMPVFCKSEGQYIIEPDINFNKQEGIDILRQAIMPIANRLKSFPKHNDHYWIVPNLIISPVEIKGIDKPGKIMGWLSGRNIFITSSVIRQGEKNIQNVFAHEFGHWVWFHTLNEEEKQQYRDIAGKINDYDRKLINIYMLKSEESLIAEWFAEDFRLYACSVDIYDESEIHSKLGHSHGEPEDLKRFFSKFIK